MNSAVNETTDGVWWRLKFERFYDSILALGLVQSWWAALVVPAAVLISFAFAFAGAGLAVTTYLSEVHHHQYVQLFMLPMFLFATTFYPRRAHDRAEGHGDGQMTVA
jgi:lipooligosaccharide transport system permease protein